VQGALELIDQLAHWLKTLTGMPAVALSPKAGAHGELCGLLAIRAAHEAAGNDARRVVLVPESAHGTNPATAAFCGYTVGIDSRRCARPCRSRGAGPSWERRDVAAVMITNPNTCGLFERDMIEIAACPRGGRLLLLRRRQLQRHRRPVRPGDLGVDAMHINLHKTFSTPHGGGGPGAGPVVLSAALAPFAPLPFVVQDRRSL
jgi:glycine dehydrogenase subunit 2